MKEPKCLRCGKCCYLIDKDNKITSTTCKYLIRTSNGKTLCRIYKNRLGTKISKNNRCNVRISYPFNIEGCPYNREEWPTSPK